MGIRAEGAEQLHAGFRFVALPKPETLHPAAEHPHPAGTAHAAYFAKILPRAAV